eukprot:533009_1
MAAGSSTPMLLTSVVGVFLKSSENNPGPGAIVGRGVFKITVIIGIMTLLSKEALVLNGWPVVRDSTYYSISIILLIFSFVGTTPGRIDWWEGLMMCLAYLGYIIFVVKYNKRIIIRKVNPDDMKIAEASHSREEEKDEEDEGGLPTTVIGWIVFIGMYPWTVLFRFSIPKSTTTTWYPITFTISVLWIGAISFLMVDSVDKTGRCIGVSANVMGSTVLAVGSNLPVALCSLRVARDGKGDMAVANVIGSNVFDVLLGLGFHWFLSTIIF